MADILKRFGFISISEFIEERLFVKICAKDIFIDCKVEFPVYPREKYLSNAEILARALEVCADTNQLCNGYCKATKKWYSTNTSRNLLKSEKWAEIFDKIGSEYSIFILTKCSIIEKQGNFFIFICGDFRDYIEKKTLNNTIERDKVLYGKENIPKIVLEEAFNNIFQDNKVDNEIKIKLEKVFLKFNKIPLKSLFKSFFYCNRSMKPNKSSKRHNDLKNDNLTIIKAQEQDSNAYNISKDNEDYGKHHDIMKYQIDPDKISNFIFMISKKFLRPIFNLKDFKILKGKIVLMLKRNIYESISYDEIIRYMKISEMKLFNNIKNLNNIERQNLVKNILVYVFNNIFLKILRFFFYSTATGFSKSKIYFFPRIEWNRKTNAFLIKYLSQFTQVKCNGVFATLRCIPKEKGFRVIANCSNQNIFAQKIGLRNSNLKVRKSPKSPNNDAYKNVNQDGRLSFKKIQCLYNEIEHIYMPNHSECHNGLFKMQVQSDSTAINGNVTCLSNNKCSDNPCLIISENKITKCEFRRPETGKINQKNGFLSVNSLTTPIQSIVCKEMKNKIGVSLLSHSLVKKNLFSYLKSKKTRLYIVKVDLKKCFDNISKPALIQIIDQLLVKNGYCFREYIVLKENDLDDKVEMKYSRGSPDLLLPFNCIESTELGSIFGCKINENCIIKENKTKFFTRSEVFEKLRNLIENTAIFYQNSYFKSEKGIPQGCNISSMLCALYYGYFDVKFSNLDVFITRYVDDFLIIADSIDLIMDFFKISDSLKEYGFHINYNKITANFNIEKILSNSKNEIQAQQKLAPVYPEFLTDHIIWCGFKIYDNEIGIKHASNHDYFRYMSYVSPINPGKKLFNKIKKLLLNRCHSILLDPSNSKNGENLFDIFFLIGRKIRIEILRANFINGNFIKTITDWCVNEIKLEILNRGIHFDSDKIMEIARKAYNKSEVLKIHKKRFNA